jgi:hypothetical protein
MAWDRSGLRIRPSALRISIAGKGRIVDGAGSQIQIRSSTVNPCWVRIQIGDPHPDQAGCLIVQCRYRTCRAYHGSPEQRYFALRGRLTIGILICYTGSLPEPDGRSGSGAYQHWGGADLIRN